MTRQGLPTGQMEQETQELLDEFNEEYCWEYQRMGRSGRQVFDEIHQLLGTIKEDEVYMEI